MEVSVPASLRQTVALWGVLIKFSHTIFALPFALGMAVIAARVSSLSAAQLGWLLLSLVSARTAAMAFNRVVDLDFDRANPRTKERPLPSGKIGLRSVIVLVVLSSSIFVLSAGFLGRHCLILSPLVLALLFSYSYTKRFTRYSHLVLGLCLALAPGGVWYALTVQVSMIPVYLMAAVMFWVAGFDILYACQDAEFDKENILYSVPALCGIDTAFLIARLFHILAVCLLLTFGIAANLGFAYFAGIFIFAGLLISEHRLISPEDLSRLEAAFFTRNGAASLMFLIAVIVDCL